MTCELQLDNCILEKAAISLSHMIKPHIGSGELVNKVILIPRSQCPLLTFMSARDMWCTDKHCRPNSHIHNVKEKQ